ncbi:hypothetical protein PGUG_03100 [Meyerozyma guilliermondii ATCC 6260]|uniref:Pyridoxal phosphate homeostasis protein n=1 Tax=Meyerozyma guilliermondii (strain ATCC 6260 / CBS 566 / DSM 6381 / JCM 1539 / NBRC 10279 / NRRL Y-324) TaxID=294746 RepID=A5DIJ9_PICGU|nr:uncharacterized protein PGUG_03100 [Meyerozyma guilliermondii ATCC 6260]EDK39002.2 hypothetical protein PGUG_03100 [Meyerozyma guilliermondii ATCC 6260]
MSSSMKKATKIIAMATENRKTELISAYEAISQRVSTTSNSRNVRLVAVSKLKPASDILALYNHGVRHFGENYVQELIGKAQELPKDIKWHFIGGLQTGKCKDLAKGIDNLYAVETIDSLKKCKKLDTARLNAEKDPLNVYLQINTSGEEQKSGFSLSDTKDLKDTVRFLMSDECKKLKLQGLMTIGSFEASTSDEENKDFKALSTVKTELDKEFNLDLELSMGMSNDFEQAIKQGSTSVRVGSSIFGARPPKSSNN